MANAASIPAERTAGADHHTEATASGWMPTNGAVRIGLTAGASTPNNKIGEAVARIFATRGIAVDSLADPRDEGTRDG